MHKCDQYEHDTFAVHKLQRGETPNDIGEEEVDVKLYEYGTDEEDVFNGEVFHKDEQGNPVKEEDIPDSCYDSSELLSLADLEEREAIRLNDDYDWGAWGDDEEVEISAPTSKEPLQPTSTSVQPVEAEQVSFVIQNCDLLGIEEPTTVLASQPEILDKGATTSLNPTTSSSKGTKKGDGKKGNKIMEQHAPNTTSVTKTNCASDADPNANAAGTNDSTEEDSSDADPYVPTHDIPILPKTVVTTAEAKPDKLLSSRTSKKAPRRHKKSKPNHDSSDSEDSETYSDL